MLSGYIKLGGEGKQWELNRTVFGLVEFVPWCVLRDAAAAGAEPCLAVSRIIAEVGCYCCCCCYYYSIIFAVVKQRTEGRTSILMMMMMLRRRRRRKRRCGRAS